MGQGGDAPAARRAAAAPCARRDTAATPPRGGHDHRAGPGAVGGRFGALLAPWRPAPRDGRAPHDAAPTPRAATAPRRCCPRGLAYCVVRAVGGLRWRGTRVARGGRPPTRAKRNARRPPPPLPSPARAGLQFPVGRCHRLLKVGGARGARGRARARRARGPTRPIPPVARHGQRPRRRHRRRLHRRHPRYESGGLEEEEAPRASKEGPRAMGRASARPQKGRPPRPRPPRAPSAALDARVAIKRRPWDGVRGVDEGVGVVTGAHFFERGAPWSGAPRRPPVLSPFHQSTSPPRCWSWPATRPRT